MSNIRFPLIKVVEAAATLCIPGMAHDHHQVAHMPATGKFQRVATVQTQTVEHPGVNMASSMAPESRKQTPEQTSNM